uniref:Reverse transcriptase domain-containing protein n=1 Tax=Tanacetum cinerariifolium TaxID=118510 RepID=A0A6L2MTB6_TANCI|nr:reverse transcriptase domain-containing protein [Tanacetum cinerariifolium]
MSDLDDIADIDLVMQLNKEDQQMQGRNRKAINRERDMAEARKVQGIENYIETHDPLPAHFKFFVVRPDATGLMSFSVIMKCTSAIWQLTYGTSPDALDEYLHMWEHYACDCLDFFTMCIIDLFTTEFLRKPDVNDIRKLYDAHNRIHGLPGMLGSIDSGANNDLTVLNHSPLSVDLLDDIAPVVPYDVNGVTFEKGYYLADGIYPQWAAFVKLFTVARDERNAVFRRRQESARKEVEKAFDKMSRDVITVGSTMRIPLLYRGEYSQWSERFMKDLEEQMDGEAMINSIQNGDQPFPVIAQVSLAGTAQNAPLTLKDPKF